VLLNLSICPPLFLFLFSFFSSPSWACLFFFIYFFFLDPIINIEIHGMSLDLSETYLILDKM